ncbi:hypothetical protein CGSMWGv1500E_04591 [Gardnerella vaginalis 1500E]|uniref:Uncharacterized protein n=1 Tax=Gardnerella vaginalis 1500E TaxID=698957 RepID=I4LZR5_GARVA|nr:hypothetical protein CGSMWGv1500E_04591 [Gardnerella vaginalis 1500E]
MTNNIASSHSLATDTSELTPIVVKSVRKNSAQIRHRRAVPFWLGRAKRIKPLFGR